jgi:hypothetical protein
MNARSYTKAIISIALVTVLLFAFLPVTYASTTTNSPSSYENNQWTNPTYAYSSNNQRASESTANQYVTYKNYGFQDSIPSGATIDNVYVKCEGYVSIGTQSVYGYVSYDGGTSWTGAHNFFLTTSESTKTWDVTSITAWNRDKLNDTNFRVKLKYYAPSGCYPNRTYLLGWNEQAKEQENKWKLINIEDLKVGDKIFALDDETKQLVWTEVAEIATHEGKWIMRDIYSGNLTVQLTEKEKWEWKAHNVFTANHPAEYVLPNGTIRRGTMKDLEVGYGLFHVFHDEPYFGRYVAPEEHYSKLFPITKINDYKYEGTVYNVIAKEHYHRPVLKYLSDEEIANMTEIAKTYYNMSFAQFFDPPIGKETGYVDWLPVQVVYTAAGTWHDITSWNLNLNIREWLVLSTWDFNLQAREWSSLSSWDFSLATRHWCCISQWMINLSARQWLTLSTWLFNLTSRQWTTIAQWNLDLITREWLTFSQWMLNLTGMHWNIISEWAVNVTVRQWVTLSTWIFNLPVISWKTISQWILSLNLGVGGYAPDKPRDLPILPTEKLSLPKVVFTFAVLIVAVALVAKVGLEKKDQTKPVVTGPRPVKKHSQKKAKRTGPKPPSQHQINGPKLSGPRTPRKHKIKKPKKR